MLIYFPAQKAGAHAETDLGLFNVIPMGSVEDSGISFA